MIYSISASTMHLGMNVIALLFVCFHPFPYLGLYSQFSFTLTDFVRINFFVTQNRKLLIFSSKMRDYIGQKSEQSLYLNPKLSPLGYWNKMVALGIKLKLSGSHSNFFDKFLFFNIFPKKIGGGGGRGNRKEPKYFQKKYSFGWGVLRNCPFLEGSEKNLFRKTIN